MELPASFTDFHSSLSFSASLSLSYPDYQYMYAHRASHPQYQDFNYSNLANNKTIWQTLPYSTRLRNSLGIGALPNVTDEHRRKFRNGDYAVGKGNSYFDKPGKN